MDKKELIIIGIIIIIGAAAAGIMFMPGDSAKYTTLDVLNKGAVGGENGTIYVKLTDEDKTSLSDKEVHIKLTDDKNNVIFEDTSKTHVTGVAFAKINNISSGEYNLNVTYDGDENYTGCSISQKLTVGEGEIEEQVDNATLIQDTLADASSSTSSSSSSQSSTSYRSSSSSSSSSQSSSSSSQSSSSSSSDSSDSYVDDGQMHEYDVDGNVVV